MRTDQQEQPNTSKWKEIWEKRTDRFDSIDMNDPVQVLVELKRIDGFDVVDGGMDYDALKGQNEDILRRLSKFKPIKSVFDVGCGCGANLFLFEREGLRIGGADYSSAQIGIAKKLFKDKAEELLCGEAIDIPTDIRYDAVIANSVFSYFPSEEYAETVLDKMLAKANVSIGLIDIHDIDKKDAFTEYRRKTIEDYDERYKELHKFFYRRPFFEDWARKNDLIIEFCESGVKGYWNNSFVFNLYCYRK